MSCFACDRRGATIESPASPVLQERLASLHGMSDPEHPEVSRTHESGGSLSAFPSGLIVFENVETGEGPWHLPNVSAERVVDYWAALAEGRHADLKTLSWRVGYGS